ncbi:MAG: gamma-glutamylcyclotransferase [Gammaproteobacteria bacterium]|uniref:gamma-glutamylcyclotransferase family protein n=1 Tax=Limnobacter sp. TaxID=2003368 RepID=UPI001D881474|nr:gamma-glutamylcyclotransferase family protein [Limnobacter sp.]MBU0783378.1 gamma-glutamylcyclotransferase [Gammaproteobacteria bacterium]MBU0850597.1 gamma-glutamylcyclotransferase [Gammaproteobacteria bacterium]MBU1268391.1 gamma-glutamylcyclotransferase [Gammaproteobacteria bacterium]MBU1530235.1 gamma-glutamylcyclotransferase [Gammaproteobacteria bacterium]MBU1780609.1 gamma-glutamylcyclotransferase [Gammaproteobacteria bacterium]
MGSEFEQDHRHVFVYGSLMYLPVWAQVVKGVYPCQNAIAKGFQRHAVPGETYPAMVENAGTQVQGLLWLDVLHEDLKRLDEFEGPEYARKEISVTLNTSGETMKVDTYIWLNPAALTHELWSVSQFEAEGLQAFLDRHVGNWNSTGQRK